jgi:hypothetical protein
VAFVLTCTCVALSRDVMYVPVAKKPLASIRTPTSVASKFADADVTMLLPDTNFASVI